MQLEPDERNKVCVPPHVLLHGLPNPQTSRSCPAENNGTFVPFSPWSFSTFATFLMSHIREGICDYLKIFDVVPQIDKINWHTIVVRKYSSRKSETNIFTSELRGGYRQNTVDFSDRTGGFNPSCSEQQRRGGVVIWLKICSYNFWRCSSGNGKIS